MAIRNGEDAEDKDKMQDQLKEDSSAMQLLASPFGGFLQFFLGHRCGWFHMVICGTIKI